MNIRSIVLLGLAALLTVPAARSQQSLEDNPAYFEIGRLEKFVDQESTLEVNISGALLRMVAEAARFEDDDLADMLYNLRAIRVLGYSLSESETRALYDQLEDISRELRSQGWERVVRVVDDGERVEVMMQATEEKIDGMLVFVLSPGDNETVFVNIVGEIRPEEIGRIGRRFRIQAIEDL